MTKEQLGKKCTESAKCLQGLCKEYKKKTGEYFKIEVYDEDDADTEDKDGNLFKYLKPSNVEFIYSSAYSKDELNGILGEIKDYINQIRNSLILINAVSHTASGRRVSRKSSRNSDNYVPINEKHIKKILMICKLIAELQRETGHTEIQWTRHFEDLLSAYDLGCEMINEGLAGWDGKYNQDVMFEAKNNTLDKKGNLDARFDNIGDWKIKEMKQGGLGVVTAWETFGNAAFRVVFNTKDIADTVERTLGKKRQSTSVSFNQLLESGAKVVACEFSRKETLNNIREHYPNVRITLNDIYDRRNLKKIAKEFAEM